MSRKNYIKKENKDFSQPVNPSLKSFSNLANKTRAIIYGYWGAEWRNYLYQTDPVKYMLLRSEGGLYTRIAGINLEAQKRYDKTLAELRKVYGDETKAIEKTNMIVTEKVIQNPKHINL